jgi:hypothetical protein
VGPGTRKLALAAGPLLVGLGGLLAVGRLAGGLPWPAGGWLTWRDVWPLLPLGVGLGRLLLGLVGGAGADWLASPGSVVTAGRVAGVVTRAVASS